jgi:hypothetical protein
MSSPRLRPLPFLVGLASILTVAACTGDIGRTGMGGPPGTGNTGGGGPTPPPESRGIGTVAIENTQDKAISRLTNAQFIQSAAALVGDAAVVGADQLLPYQDRHGAFRNTGFAQDQPFDLIKAYDAAASYIVDHVTDWPAFHMRWGQCTQLSCIKTFLKNFTEGAFRHPTADADVNAFQPILDAAAAAMMTYDETVKLLVRATLQAPDFLYLFGDATLTDYQLASRISYFVSDGPPDAELYAAAKAQDLRNAAGLDKQIDRLLAKNVTRFASAFGFDYLDLQRATTRNLVADPATVIQLMNSAVASFASLVEQNRPVSAILTLDTFVTNEAAATWISGAASKATTVKANPSYPFMGLLTHPAALMAMSNSVFGSTVSRGSFIADQMMCVPPTPPPPPGIQQTDLSALLPPNPTQRDIGEARMADNRCKGCHAQFESFSFAFNKWGGDGTFKTDPTLKDNGPITTGLGDIPFNGYADFLPKLAGSTQFHRCVTDQVIRYGLQHTEYPPELVQTVLAEATKLNPDVTFPSLMKALIRQTIFTTR